MTINPKQRLGKGLEALIPTTSVEEEIAGTDEAAQVIPEVVFTAGRTVVNISVHDIVPNPRQPRVSMQEEPLRELADSIREQGLIQPILVKRQGEKYELVAGERRWRASMLAGLTLIPAIIKNFSEEQSLEVALIENLQREDLNPMDEAEAYFQLANQFGLTQETIAQKVGKNRSTVANSIRLTELPDEIKLGIRGGRVTVGHVRPLLSLTGVEEQLTLYRELLTAPMNVRDVEQMVGQRRLSPITTRRRVMSVHPELLEVLNALLDYFGTKVKISGTPRRGRIILEYFSEEDLERVLELMTGKKLAQPKENHQNGNRKEDAGGGITEAEFHSLVDS